MLSQEQHQINLMIGTSEAMISKVREIDISMIIPTPTTSENNDPSNCIGRGVFGTCYKRLFQGLPVCVKICNYQSERASN